MDGPIKRYEIESITFVKSIEGHSLSDKNCFDVSNNSSGDIIAWYEDKNNDGYYEITIGSKNGKVVANYNSSYLFAYIGLKNTVENKTVEIKGLENLDTTNTTEMSYMFFGTYKIRELDLNSLKTENTTSMVAMFADCSGLKNLNVNNLDTKKVVNMSCMFENCLLLEELDLNNFDMVNVKQVAEMFSGCKKLKTIYCQKDWNVSNIQSSGLMFNNCESLVGAISYNSENINIKYANPKTGYFTDTSNQSKFIWPIDSQNVTAKFGARNAPGNVGTTIHKGWDVSVPVGTEIKAAAAGKVTIAKYSESAGNYIAIDHGNGYVTKYMHCEDGGLLVNVGDTVSKGQVIAKSGNTGRSTGPHLHFQIEKDGTAVDPANYFNDDCTPKN